MPIYLAKAKIPTRDAPQGRPAWARAWVPVGCGPDDVAWADRRWILLSRFTDHALVHLRDAKTHPDLELLAVDGEEGIADTARTHLASLLGDRQFSRRVTIKEALAATFLNPPPDGRWGTPLRPNRRQGLYRIDLQLPNDPHPWWQRAGPRRTRSTVTLSDDFNRGGNLDGSTASGGGVWDQLEGTTINLSANTVGIPAGAGFSMAWITTDLDTDDQYAQLDATTLSSTVPDNAVISVVVRMAGGSATQGYSFEILFDGTARLFRWDTDANLDTGTVTLSLPDTIYLSFDGSAYDCRFNGTTVTGMSGTNTLFTGIFRTGLAFYTSGVGVARGDNFLAGDLTAVGPGPNDLNLRLDEPEIGASRF